MAKKKSASNTAGEKVDKHLSRLIAEYSQQRKNKEFRPSADAMIKAHNPEK